VPRLPHAGEDQEVEPHAGEDQEVEPQPASEPQPEPQPASRPQPAETRPAGPSKGAPRSRKRTRSPETIERPLDERPLGLISEVGPIGEPPIDPVAQDVGTTLREAPMLTRVDWVTLWPTRL